MYTISACNVLQIGFPIKSVRSITYRGRCLECRCYICNIWRVRPLFVVLTIQEMRYTPTGNIRTFCDAKYTIQAVFAYITKYDQQIRSAWQPYRAAPSYRYSAASFAALQALSFLHSPALSSSCCNSVRFFSVLEACNLFAETTIKMKLTCEWQRGNKYA
jgi:hypothetical protein